MKKTLVIIGILFTLLSLIGCTPDENITINEIIDDLQITFAEGDQIDLVTSNLGLPLKSQLTSNASISWQSNNPDVIDNYGAVNRQDEDVIVILTATISYGGLTDTVIVTATVKGTIVYYHVSFDVEGEETTLRIVEGQSVAEPEDPELEGYLFQGWYTDLAGEVPFDFSTEIQNDLTLFAKFTLQTAGTYQIELYQQNIEDNEYTLLDTISGEAEAGTDKSIFTIFNGFHINETLSTLSGTVTVGTHLSLKAYYDRDLFTVTYMNDGSIQEEQHLKYQTQLSSISNPMKEGYELLGWTLVLNGSSLYAFGAPVTSSLTLYAKWTPIRYTIIFEENGGTEVNDITKSYGLSVFTPEAPTRVGWTFLGWYSDIDLQEPFVFSTMPLGGITLYAKWQQNPKQLSFVYGDDTIDPIMIIPGDPITLPEEPIRIGYDFDGWFMNNQLTVLLNLEIMPDADLVLYGKWSLSSYEVIFDINGVESSVEVFHGSKVDQPADPILIDYMFINWYTTTTFETLFDFNMFITEPTIIYARMDVYILGDYETKIYKQNLEDEAYTLTNSTQSQAEVGTIITISNSFTGYQLNTELSVIQGEVVSESTLTLNAYFDRNVYSVTYIDEGVEYAVEYLKYQSPILQVENPSKEDYVFLGWTLTLTGTNYYAFNSPITSNITLYAQWRLPDNYVYEGYYEGAEGLTGSALNTFLRTITTTGFTGVDYGASRYILDETDRDPNNSSKLILLYLGTSVSSTWDLGVTWNREHVWPQSLLGVSADNSVINAASDLHNLKPADPGTNSSRSNKYFDNATTTVSYNPRNAVKGDIARILFYMDVRYIQYALVNEDQFVNGEPTVYQMAMLRTLLQWHVQDPVDSFEMNRNNVIYSYQHNRNPFIDHPEFAEKLYGPITLSSGDIVNVSFYTLDYTIEIDVYILNTPFDKKDSYSV